MRNYPGNQDVCYAGFFARAAAYIIDSAIVVVGLLAVRLLIAAVTVFYNGGLLDSGLLFHYTLKDILLYICQVLYFILCTYTTGTTLGKRAMNLRVVNAEGGVRLSLWNVVYRETVGRFLSAFILGVGYIVAGVDQEKRGFHDMLCDTRVIYAKRVKVFPVYRKNPPPPAYGPGPKVPPGRPPMPPNGGSTPSLGGHRDWYAMEPLMAEGKEGDRKNETSGL